MNFRHCKALFFLKLSPLERMKVYMKKKALIIEGSNGSGLIIAHKL